MLAAGHEPVEPAHGRVGLRESVEATLSVRRNRTRRPGLSRFSPPASRRRGRTPRRGRGLPSPWACHYKDGSSGVSRRPTMTTPRRRLLHRRFGPWTRHQCLAQVAPTSKGGTTPTQTSTPASRSEAKVRASFLEATGSPRLRARAPEGGLHRPAAGASGGSAESASSRHRGRRGAGRRAARGRPPAPARAGAGPCTSPTTPPGAPRGRRRTGPHADARAGKNGASRAAESRRAPAGGPRGITSRSVRKKVSYGTAVNSGSGASSMRRARRSLRRARAARRRRPSMQSESHCRRAGSNPPRRRPRRARAAACRRGPCRATARATRCPPAGAH